MKRWFVLAVWVAGLAGAAGAKVEARHFPADASVVVHLDLKALNESPMGQYILRSLDSDAQRGLMWLQSASGVNLTNDVDSLVIYGKGNLQTGAVFVAYGRFDVARLTSLAAGAKAYQNKAVGARSLMSWEDKGKRVSLCFADPTVAILSQDEQEVLKALARFDGLPQGTDGDGRFSRVLSHADGRFLALQADNLKDLPARNPQFQMVKQADALLLEVSQLAVANGLDGTLSVKAASKEQAQQLQQAALGIQALLTLQADQNPDAAALAQQARVVVQEDVVSLNLRITEEQLSKMVKVRVEQQRQAREARRQARQAKRRADMGVADGDDEGDGVAAGGDKKPERPAF